MEWIEDDGHHCIFALRKARIDQTCFGQSGGLAPISLAVFQGGRLDAAGAEVSSSCMVILLVFENDQHGLTASVPGRQSASAI
jgi:hypothetical protein